MINPIYPQPNQPLMQEVVVDNRDQALIVDEQGDRFQPSSRCQAVITATTVKHVAIGLFQIGLGIGVIALGKYCVNLMGQSDIETGVKVLGIGTTIISSVTVGPFSMIKGVVRIGSSIAHSVTVGSVLPEIISSDMEDQFHEDIQKEMEDKMCCR